MGVRMCNSRYILCNIATASMPGRTEAISVSHPRLDQILMPRGTVSSAVALRLGAGTPSWVPVKTEAESKQRSRIWDLHHSLHCSIVGTCLTTAELRRLLVRFNVQDAATADEHGVHQLGVMLASSQKAGAKLLQKALDRAHKSMISHFATAKNADAVLSLWEDAVKRGDIPGAYWAALTHPTTTDAVVKRVFGEVHMLSHLVGAANRADIRRLRHLEEDNAALTTMIERQQRQLRDGFKVRDETIQRLTDALACRSREGGAASANADDARALAEALADRDRRLTQERTRRERLESRLEKLTAERDEADALRRRAERECKTVRAELAAVEAQIEMLLPREDDCVADTLDLRGATILYVGGRANQTPRLKSLVERVNGRFLHHDGGLEHNVALLPGLVSRADLVMFPADCVSHEAAGSIKRNCRQLGKRYLPLHTSSLTCLLSGLAVLRTGTASTSSPASA